MPVQLEQYRIFAAVAQNKSFRKAAEQLFVTQPAVSQSIKQLETQLGAQLFVRTPKGADLTESGEILGVFCYFLGEDPTYQSIEDGAWINDRPYGVIHRIAVAVHQRGVASACFSWCYAACGNVKIDTHRDNIPMQRSLEKNGFSRCGIIHLANGDPRIAYQKG